MYLKKRKKKDTNNPYYISQISTLLLTKWSYTNSPPKYDYSHIQNYFPFLSQVTRVRVSNRHRICTGRASISIIIILGSSSSIIIIIILRSLWSRWRRSLRNEATHDRLPSCNTADINVHLIQLNRKCIKASIHALKLHHDVSKSHIARRRGGSGCGWSKSGWSRTGGRSC